MVKANRPGSHKAGSNHSQAGEKSQAVQPTGQQPSTMPSSSQGKGKQNPKSRQRTIGGTAVTGAKSTQPKELSTGTPANQQAEYYNREMRRRMEHMGNDSQEQSLQKRRQKREQRLKERRSKEVEKVRHALPGGKVDTRSSMHRMYITLGIIAAVIAVIIIAYLVIRGI